MLAVNEHRGVREGDAALVLARGDFAEFLKQIGMWYVLTDGGKNMDGFTKPQVRAEKNKSIRELSRKINASSFNADGSLNYLGGAGTENGDDILLSDDWKIGQ